MKKVYEKTKPMALGKDQGIVIRSLKVNEADKLISLLSEKGPRRSYLVRGILKSRHRPIAATEIGSLIELHYYEKDNLEFLNVKEVTLVERHDSLKSTVSGLYFLSYISELADRLLPEGEIHTKEARLIRMAYEETNRNGLHFQILPFLKIRLLIYLGVLSPEFLCMDCGEEVYYKKEAEVLSNLEIYCGDCRIPEKNHIDIIRFLSDASRIKYSQLYSKVIPHEILWEADLLLNRFLHNYLQKDLKTERDLYRILNFRP